MCDEQTADAVHPQRGQADNGAVMHRSERGLQHRLEELLGGQPTAIRLFGDGLFVEAGRQVRAADSTPDEFMRASPYRPPMTAFSDAAGR